MKILFATICFLTLFLCSAPSLAHAYDENVFAYPPGAEAELADSGTRKRNWHGLLTRYQQRYFQRGDGNAAVHVSWKTIGYALQLSITEKLKRRVDVVLRIKPDGTFDVFRAFGKNDPYALVGKAKWLSTRRLEISVEKSAQILDFSDSSLQWSTGSATLSFGELNETDYPVVLGRIYTAEYKAKNDPPLPEWLTVLGQAIGKVADQLEADHQAKIESDRQMFSRLTGLGNGSTSASTTDRPSPSNQSSINAASHATAQSVTEDERGVVASDASEPAGQSGTRDLVTSSAGDSRNGTTDTAKVQSKQNEVISTSSEKQNVNPLYLRIEKLPDPPNRKTEPPVKTLEQIMAEKREVWLRDQAELKNATKKPSPSLPAKPCNPCNVRPQ